MVPVLARMSVVIKAQHETSVMTGNYEMGYVFTVHGPLVVLNRRDKQWRVPGDAADKRQHVGNILVRKAGEDDGGPGRLQRRG